MVKLRLLAAVLLVLGIWLLLTTPASADHNIYLPMVPNTPMMQSIKTTQEVLWCVNDTAAVFPDFVAQLHDVNDEYTARVSIRHRQVEWGTPATTGCQEQHNFIVGLKCGGCAAQVFYANFPVEVEYKADLAFVDWRTTAGHEIGHSRLGLGEMYRDSGGSIRCTGKTWTVMDCSSGVRYPQPFDVENGCAVLATLWCGPQSPPDAEWGACEQYGDGSWGCWNNWGAYWQRTIWPPATYHWQASDPVWRCVEACP